MKYKTLDTGVIINTHKKVEVSQRLNKTNGYMYVDLWLDNKASTHSVHRLVASTYLESIEGCNIVDHIDGNKTNNNASNLRYVTQRDNMRHYFGYEDSNVYITNNGRYRVRVTLNGKTRHIGVYDTIELAREARDKSYTNE